MQLEAPLAALPSPHLGGGGGGGGGVKRHIKYHFNRYKFRYTILVKFASRSQEFFFKPNVSATLQWPSSVAIHNTDTHSN